MNNPLSKKKKMALTSSSNGEWFKEGGLVGRRIAKQKGIDWGSRQHGNCNTNIYLHDQASSTVKLCLYNHIKYLGHLPREMNILKSVEKDRNLAVWAGSWPVKPCVWYWVKCDIFYNKTNPPTENKQTKQFYHDLCVSHICRIHSVLIKSHYVCSSLLE